MPPGFLSVVEPTQKPTSRSLLHFQKWGNNSLHFGADLDRGGKWAALADVRTLWTLLHVVLHIWCPLANMSKTWKFAVLTEKRQKSCLSLVQLFNYSAVIPSGIFSLLSQHLKLKHICAGSWGKQKQTHISMLCMEVDRGTRWWWGEWGWVEVGVWQFVLCVCVLLKARFICNLYSIKCAFLH